MPLKVTTTKETEIIIQTQTQMAQTITVAEVLLLLKEIQTEINPQVQEEQLRRLEEIIRLREAQLLHKVETMEIQITHLRGEVERLSHL